MCGIAGFWGRFSPELLDAMTKEIAHRGPDGHGTYFSQEHGIGLGHRRLSIIDLSERGAQPMWDAGKQAVITYNGEIYNYRELRRMLEREGYTFNSDTDTEVLLNLYLYKGVDMLNDLNGIFAFAIWDTQKKSLFMAKDHLGVKPLYYANTKNGLLFGSELKSLIKSKDLDKSLRLESFYYYLLYLWTPAPYTPFEQVEKLAPGHAMLYQSPTEYKKWRYYDLPYDKPVLNISAQEAAEELSYKIKVAVQRQMVSDVEVGSFLSGGLDSSAVVAFANKVSPNLKCFTMQYHEDWMVREGFEEDYPYAKRTAECLGTDLHVIKTGPEMFDDIEAMVYHLDEPHGDLTPLNAWLISRLARQNGIKVLLSGAGGDDILTGYRRHYAARYEKYVDYVPLPIRSLAKNVFDRMPQENPWVRRINKLANISVRPEKERIDAHFHWIAQNNLQKLFRPEVFAGIAPKLERLPLYQSLNDMPSARDALSRIMYLDGRHFLPDHNLAFTDKMGMATGVEIRVPLLDVDLVDYSVRLPMTLKQNGKIGKWIFKKAMEPYLPRDIIYRSKTGFSPPLRNWLANDLSDVVDDVLAKETIDRRKIFDSSKINKLIIANKNKEIDASFIILGLVNIELWNRMFIDNNEQY